MENLIMKFYPVEFNGNTVEVDEGPREPNMKN